MSRVLTFKHPDQEPVIIELDDKPRWTERLLWLLLSALASAMVALGLRTLFAQ